MLRQHEPLRWNKNLFIYLFSKKAEKVEPNSDDSEKPVCSEDARQATQETENSNDKKVLMIINKHQEMQNNNKNNTKKKKKKRRKKK